MDMDTSTISLGSICEGCLSVDRKLTSIYGDETKGFHCILESVDQSHTILLCWECAAVLRRLLRFRDQVKRARDCLVGFMVHQATISTLSQLKITNNGITENISYNSEDPVTERNKTESKEELSAVKKERRRNTQRNVQNEELKAEPVAFIKVEERDFYDDASFDDASTAEAVDHKELEAELKLDKVTVKRKRKKRKEYSFDESDDEPLKKTKKSKVENESKKGRRATREKPAGVVTNARVDNQLRQLNVSGSQLEMLLLTWEQIEEERTKALTSEAFTRHEYRCYDCVLGFNHRMKLDDHMKKHDPASGTISCSLCKVQCKDARALSSHRRRHRLRWRCTICGSMFSRCAVAADHLSRTHSAPLPQHQCSVCGRVETWRCTICGSMFSRCAVAADHLSRTHSAPLPQHQCSVCGRVETTLGKLRYHMKSHSERQNCELCGKSFKDRSSLRTHLFIHRGEKDYTCSSCGKRFLFKKALEVHLVTHQPPQHLYCHLCDMNFKNSMSFYQHMRYNLKHIDPAKLKHTCTVCGKRFAKSSRLNEHHIAVHLKHTPIRCELPDCTFSCSSRPVLRTHTRMVHRNARTIRNHVCHSCGKTYTTKKTLEGHIRSHTGERPFRCGECPAAFGYEAALYNHNKLVHLKQSRNRAAPTAEPLPWLSSGTQAEIPTAGNATSDVT